MGTVSKLFRTTFEILNEVFIAVGAGLVGIAILVHHGYKTNQLLRTLSVAAVSIGSLLYVFQTKEDLKPPNHRQIILISGCDSGLGYSLAIHSAKIGFTVVAGFLCLSSEGAKELRNYKNITQIHLDVTNRESVFVAVETINQYLNSNPNYEFHALVNNAAVMVFGEFEWQTERLIEQQIKVNLLGTMNLTKAFLPLLRRHDGRLINITSHCSFECLPGLSVYGATKSGIKALTDGLRVELSKYGVKVISFTPGSFYTQCNIMARHPEYVLEMHKNMNREQREFYDDYFQRYHAFLTTIPVPKGPTLIDNGVLYRKFEEAILLEHPRHSYKIEPWRYCIYHWLFRISPTPIRDYFVLKFMTLPEYHTAQTW